MTSDVPEAHAQSHTASANVDSAVYELHLPANTDSFAIDSDVLSRLLYSKHCNTVSHHFCDNSLST